MKCEQLPKINMLEQQLLFLHSYDHFALKFHQNCWFQLIKISKTKRRNLYSTQLILTHTTYSCREIILQNRELLCAHYFSLTTGYYPNYYFLGFMLTWREGTRPKGPGTWEQALSWPYRIWRGSGPCSRHHNRRKDGWILHYWSCAPFRHRKTSWILIILIYLVQNSLYFTIFDRHFGMNPHSWSVKVKQQNAIVQG